jgi:hypothetical protein
MKHRIAIDFDGTICENGPFVAANIIPYKPEPFAKEALIKLSEYFTIVIYSVRAQREEGVKAIASWMESHGIPYSEITDKKEMAMFYIDNRAIRYNGSWKEVLKEIATLDVEPPIRKL